MLCDVVSKKKSFEDMPGMIEIKSQIPYRGVARYAQNWHSAQTPNHVVAHNGMVAKKVRQTIKELGGTMPEKLAVADSIKKKPLPLGEVGEGACDMGEAGEGAKHKAIKGKKS